MDFSQPTPELIAGRDIVITGQQPWDTDIGSNCKNIAEEFSRHNRVLYVNSALDRYTAFRGKDTAQVVKRKEIIQGGRKSIEQIAPNLWVLDPPAMVESINWIGNQTIFELLNKRNNRIFAKKIGEAIDQLGFKDIILFNDNDIFRSFHLKELLKPSISIYYSRDFMLAVDYWARHGKKMEPELIAKSDLCLANSTYLAKYCHQYNPNSFYVGQGCDLESFTKGIGSPHPNDLAHIPRPIIGYVGALQSIRLDIEVIAHLAGSRPDWSIVLVGPEDEQFRQSSLHAMKNVHFLGSRDISKVPAYINAFDVCINPQLVNQVTIGNYPRKIDEYLAMGKPVLATATDAMSIFKDHVYLATAKEDYVSLAERALREDSEELQGERKAFAAQHTWENSVGSIYAAINKVTAQGENSPIPRGPETLPAHLFILGTPRHDDDLVSTSFMMAKVLSKNFKVYYIDNPYTYRDYLRSRNTPKFEKREKLFDPKSKGLLDIGIANLKVVITPVLHSIHFVPEGNFYRRLLKLNESIIRRRIRQVLQTEGIRDYIYLNSFNFHYPEVAKGLDPALTVYQSMDPMIMDFDKKHGLISEPKIVAGSDLVVCTAKSLYEQFQKINPHTFFLPNAADIAHSSKALDEALPVHPAILKIKGPIVGYFGNIERRIDYDLLMETAGRLPHFSFVLVGPFHEEYFPAGFTGRNNIILTGKMPYEDMPSVIKGFDVAIIPFKKDEASRSIFPLKLFEYLGAGKPVVATSFNPDLKEFTGEFVRYCEDADSFADAIVRALDDKPEMKESRLALAMENTWDHRVKELIELMIGAVQRKRGLTRIS